MKKYERLGEYISEYSVRNKANEDIPVYSVTNTNGFCTEYFDKDVASKDQTNYKIVPKGYFAYNPSRINVGSIDCQSVDDRVIVSPLYVVLKADERVDNNYLLHYLKSDIGKTYINELASGSVRANLKFSILQEFPFPMIPIEEQKEKMAVIAKIDENIACCDSIIEKLDLAVKSRFIEMFGDSNKTCKLGEVCTKITDGTHKTPNYLAEGITFISAKNIVNGELDYSDVKHISEEEYSEIQKRCGTEKYDILLSKSGSLGQPAIIKTDEKLGLFESLAVIKYDRNKLIPEFLKEQLKSDHVQWQFSMSEKGVAVKHLHLEVIKNIDIVLPDIGLQKEFASFVDQIDKSKLAVQEMKNKMEILKASVMQEYFC